MTENLMHTPIFGGLYGTIQPGTWTTSTSTSPWAKYHESLGRLTEVPGLPPWTSQPPPTATRSLEDFRWLVDQMNAMKREALPERKVEPVPLAELAGCAKRATRDEARELIMEVLAA